MDSEIIILGKNTWVVKCERKRPKYSGNTLYVPLSFDKYALREYKRMRLRQVLKSEFLKLKKNGNFYLVGEVDFELVKKFRDKPILSVLKGSTIFVREDVIRLTRIEIREILVHELAHIFSKHHDEKFQMAMRYIGGGQRRLPIQI